MPTDRSNSIEAFSANSEGAWLIGFAYMAGSLVAGYGALWLGVILARLI